MGKPRRKEGGWNGGTSDQLGKGGGGSFQRPKREAEAQKEPKKFAS